MLETYSIYFKKRGKINLAFKGFEIDRDRIIVYDSRNDPATQEAFLCFDQVAALFSEDQAQEPAGFTIHLVNGENFRICADYFRIEESNLTFYRYQPGARNLPLKNIHVALHEVAAITPENGLERG